MHREPTTGGSPNECLLPAIIGAHESILMHKLYDPLHPVKLRHCARAMPGICCPDKARSDKRIRLSFVSFPKAPTI